MDSQQTLTSPAPAPAPADIGPGDGSGLRDALVARDRELRSAALAVMLSPDGDPLGENRAAGI